MSETVDKDKAGQAMQSIWAALPLLRIINPAGVASLSELKTIADVTA